MARAPREAISVVSVLDPKIKLTPISRTKIELTPIFLLSPRSHAKKLSNGEEKFLDGVGHAIP
jgi:hypothetical protein